MIFRQPTLTDGIAVYALIKASPPLDLNSRYAYFLACSHFAESCAVAEEDGAVVGFLSGYRRPDNPDVLFVWQVAVNPARRGQGLAGRMLDAILARPVNREVAWVEATVGPSNAASETFFKRFAERRGTGFDKQPFLGREHFGGENHEEEDLLRLGPLTGAGT